MNTQLRLTMAESQNFHNRRSSTGGKNRRLMTGGKKDSLISLSERQDFILRSPAFQAEKQRVLSTAANRASPVCGYENSAQWGCQAKQLYRARHGFVHRFSSRSPSRHCGFPPVVAGRNGKAIHCMNGPDCFVPRNDEADATFSACVPSPAGNEAIQAKATPPNCFLRCR
jgi:hypothetical protein